MNGAVPESTTTLPAGEVKRLEESFRIFTQVTRSLEQAYRRLEGRARGVDERLRDANRRLVGKVAELKRVTGELNGFLDAIPCGVLTCGPEGTITRVNPAAERILGRPAAELIGRDARTLLDYRGQPILLLGRGDLRPGVTVDRQGGGLDGSVRHLSGSVALLPDGGRLEIITDQTEVAHLRAQVNRLDTLAALGEMAAGVAHEIRNPMSGVEGFAGLLEKALRSEEPAPPSQLLRYADRIRRGVAEVNGIITNLLLWARPEQAHVQAIALQPLLRELGEELSSAPGIPSVAHFEVKVAPAGLEVAADRLKLKLAVGNLVRNALEAAGPQGTVRVRAQPTTAGVSISVQDDGPGVAPEIKPRLFRPFTSNKVNGTGLGLALARKFAELHGGEIALESIPGQGARFVINLPGTPPGGDRS